MKGPKHLKYNIPIWTGLVVTLLLIGCTTQVKPTLSPLSPLSPVSTEEQLSGVPPVTDTPDPAISPIIISEVITQGEVEVITIKNISNVEQNLRGMALLNPVTMEHVFLPEKTLLPGDSFKVYNGPDVGKVSDGIKWLGEPVLRQPGDYIVLLNPAGRAIWYYVNP